MVARTRIQKVRWSPAYELATAAALYLSAFLLAAATSSASFRWVGWITLLPLFHAIRRSTPVGAAAAGALWGAALYTFGGFIVDTGIARSIGSLALLTMIPAAYAGAGAWMTRRVGFSPYLLALGWIGVELALRPLGLQLGLLAATQGDGFAIRILGSFAGYALVAFVVAYVNAALLSVICDVKWVSDRPRPLHGVRRALRRLIPQDGLLHLGEFIRQAQPRGPPALVFIRSSRSTGR